MTTCLASGSKSLICSPTWLAHARRSPTLIRFSVCSYGSIIWSGEMRPYFEERMYQGSAVLSTYARARRNHSDRYRSLARADDVRFLLTQETRYEVCAPCISRSVIH